MIGVRVKHIAVWLLKGDGVSIVQGCERWWWDTARKGMREGRNWCLGVDRCMHVAGHMAGEEQ